MSYKGYGSMQCSLPSSDNIGMPEDLPFVTFNNIDNPMTYRELGDPYKLLRLFGHDGVDVLRKKYAYNIKQRPIKEQQTIYAVLKMFNITSALFGKKNDTFNNFLSLGYQRPFDAINGIIYDSFLIAEIRKVEKLSSKKNLSKQQRFDRLISEVNELYDSILDESDISNSEKECIDVVLEAIDLFFCISKKNTDDFFNILSEKIKKWEEEQSGEKKI